MMSLTRPARSAALSRSADLSDAAISTLKTLLGPIPTSSSPTLTVSNELRKSAIAPRPATSTCVAATASPVAPNVQSNAWIAPSASSDAPTLVAM